MTKRRSRKLGAFVALLALAVVALALYVRHVPDSPFDGDVQSGNSSGQGNTAKPTADLVQKGEYVARLADCVACHSTPQGAPFAGGLEMATPLGSIFATNITPDKFQGIGAYSLSDFDRAVRHGVAPGGRRLYPAMPYPSYSKFSDEDVAALYAYFMTAIKPADAVNKPSEIPWPLSIRWPVALWNALFTEPGTYVPQPGQDALWSRGAYIVQGPGHCGSCHTPRGLAFNEKALSDTDPAYLSGALLDGWYAPSLRRDPDIGLGRWSDADIVQFLKTGRNKHAVVYGSMTEAFNNSTQFMTDQDLQAVARYLGSLPSNAAKDAKAWEYRAETATANGLGAQIFASKCSACHGADGRGQGQWIPPLSGAASILAPHDDSAINITLNGSQRIVSAGVPDAYRMPPYRSQLSDSEVSEVLSYIRGSWGNSGKPVDPEHVRTLRARTDPASSTPIILQMR